MTEIEKAQKYFMLRGIHAYIDGDSLYIVTPDNNSLNVMVATSEIIYRAELYDDYLTEQVN